MRPQFKAFVHYPRHPLRPIDRFTSAANDRVIEEESYRQRLKPLHQSNDGTLDREGQAGLEFMG